MWKGAPGIDLEVNALEKGRLFYFLTCAPVTVSTNHFYFAVSILLGFIVMINYAVAIDLHIFLLDCKKTHERKTQNNISTSDTDTI